jgi:hypothetical protein
MIADSTGENKRMACHSIVPYPRSLPILAAAYCRYPALTTEDKDVEINTRIRNCNNNQCRGDPVVCNIG